MKPFEFLFGASSFATPLIAIGIWLLTVYCIYDKWDRKKEKGTWVVADVFNAGLTPITLVLTFTITVSLSFWFPQIMVRIGEAASDRDQALTRELADLGESLSGEELERLRAKVDQLNTRLEEETKRSHRIAIDLATAQAELATEKGHIEELRQQSVAWERAYGHLVSRIQNITMAELLELRLEKGGEITEANFAAFAQTFWGGAEMDGKLVFQFVQPNLSGLIFEFRDNTGLLRKP